MQTVIIVIHLLVVLALIGFVLLQKSEGGALGIGGGGGGFMSSRGTGNLLTRTTGFLAAAFFATSLILSILAGWGRQPESIIRTRSDRAQPVRAGTGRADERALDSGSAAASRAGHAGGARHAASAAVAVNLDKKGRISGPSAFLGMRCDFARRIGF